MPKSLDLLDSALLALRVRLVGKLGSVLRRAALWSSGSFLIAVNPHGWAVLLAALASYLSAELVYRAAAALPIRRRLAPAR